jgi:transcriptional regulator with XRE-family HTH domain
MKTFEERLKKAMDAKNINGAQLSKMLNKAGRSAASSWLTGKAKPPADALAEISNILQVSIDWLLTGTVAYNQESPGTVSLAMEDYVEYLTLKNEKLVKENSSLKDSTPISN